MPGEDDSYGISLVLVNTDKGMKWFLSDYDKEYCVKINIEDACKHNGQLNHPQPKPAKREEFLWMWRMQGYKAVDDQFRRTYRKRRWIAIAVYYFPYGIKKKIKKLMNMK